MATSPLGILLDLDDTLVLTKVIEYLRHRREWQAARAAFGQTSLPPGTREFVAGLSAMGHVGVVTSSPRPYAESLLRYHGLDLKVLVAYHDIAWRKPAPDALLAGARQMGVPPSRCVSIGDRDLDDLAARAAGMGSILVDWGNGLPGACRTWAEVLEHLAAMRTQ